VDFKFIKVRLFFGFDNRRMNVSPLGNPPIENVGKPLLKGYNVSVVKGCAWV